MKSLLLVLRDPNRGGKSVEEIYRGLSNPLSKEFFVMIYCYEDNKSVYYNIRNILKKKADIVHITSDMYWIALLLPNRKTIITIHDIGRYLSLTGLKRVIYKWMYIVLPAIQVKAIITVSGFTEISLGKVLAKEYLNKVHIVHNPIPDQFQLTKPCNNLEEPIILQVGTDFHKNLENVVIALKGLHIKYFIIGSLTDEQTEFLDESKIDYTSFASLDYSEVKSLYEQCSLVTFVSLYEGFGMPIIEAQAVGRPVLTSRKGSLVEVAGRGAHFIEDPLDSEEIRRAVLKILNEDDYRAELVRLGSENVSRFSLKFIASEYSKVYNEVLNQDC